MANIVISFQALNHFMKKSLIFKSIFPAFLMFLFSVSCSKTKGITLESQSKLSEDATFISLTTNTYEYLRFVVSNFKNKGLTQKNVEEKLIVIQSKSFDYTSQMKAIDSIFGKSYAEKLAAQMKLHSQSWKSLQFKYGKISAQTLEDECLEVLLAKFLSSPSPVINTGSKPVQDAISDGCGWRYYLCSAAITGAAIACHAACDATALATTAGFGIPACVAICGTAQAYGMVDCADKYCH